MIAIHRLGKYSSERSRPLLLKLSRSYDVNAVLSQRFLLAKGSFNVKPCMSPTEWHIKSILLKEHRQLINSGVNCKDIKIWKNKLFRGQVLFGEVIDSSFRPAISDSQKEKTILLETFMKRIS